MKKTKAGYTQIIADFLGSHRKTVAHWINRETAKNHTLIMEMISDMESAEKEAITQTLQKWEDKLNVMGISKEKFLYQKEKKERKVKNARKITNPLIIKEQLLEAEKEYAQYLPLFSNDFFTNHPKNQLIVVKKYTLMKKCVELISSNNYMIKEIFEVYKTFESASTIHYYSFLRKIKEFNKMGVTSFIHGRIGQRYIKYTA